MPDAAFFARARSAAEWMMEDSCTITRDPLFVADSTLDTVTGVLTAPSPETIEIYDGPCTVTPEAREQSDAEEGAAPMVRSRYRATIPLSADEVVIGDVLTVTASVRDSLLVDASFVVHGATVSTNAYQRILDLKRSVRADAQ